MPLPDCAALHPDDNYPSLVTAGLGQVRAYDDVDRVDQRAYQMVMRKGDCSGVMGDKTGEAALSILKKWLTPENERAEN